MMQWKLLQSVDCYRGFFKVAEQHLQIERFAGGTLELKREVFERGKAAAVLIYDPKADALVLVEQFRPGAIGSANPWLLELVAGMVEAGEDGTAVVQREAQEEASCVIDSPFLICDYLASPGGSSERIELYAATADSSKVAQYAGLLDEGEDIKVHVIKRDAVMRLLENGQIQNAMTLIGVQWLALNFSRWQQQDFGCLSLLGTK